MKVEIAENHAAAAITCWCGPEEIKVSHMEIKLDAEGQLLNESEVMVKLLDAASAAVASIPQPEPTPEEGETKAQRLEREERNRKLYVDWTIQRADTEAAEEEATLKAAADAQAQAAEAKAPPPEPQPEPQPELQPQNA